MGNEDPYLELSERNFSNSPSRGHFNILGPGGTTTNQQSISNGAVFYQETFHREDTGYAGLPPRIEVTDAVLNMLERYRDEGMFLREGFSISYTTIQLSSLFQIAIASQHLTGKSDNPKYGRIHQLVMGALGWMGNLFLEWRTEAGYVLSTGPRWKHVPWENNISGMAIYAFHLERPMKNNKNKWYYERLVDSEHPWWKQPSHKTERLFNLIIHSPKGKALLSELRRLVDNVYYHNWYGRVQYQIWWAKNPISLYTPKMYPIKENDGSVNLTFEVDENKALIRTTGKHYPTGSDGMVHSPTARSHRYNYGPVGPKSVPYQLPYVIVNEPEKEEENAERWVVESLLKLRQIENLIGEMVVPVSPKTKQVRDSINCIATLQTILRTQLERLS